jgi:hypothetical protein
MSQLAYRSFVYAASPAGSPGFLKAAGALRFALRAEGRGQRAAVLVYLEAPAPLGSMGSPGVSCAEISSLIDARGMPKINSLSFVGL